MDESGIINFYNLRQVQKHQPEYHNPNFDEDSMPLKHPFRIVCVGSSGSGKTNITMNIIHKLSGTFNKLFIYTANKKEPLYEFLEENLPREQLEIREGLKHFNEQNMNTGIGEGQVLIIFDDLVLSKDQANIEELFIRGRKLNDKHGISVIYLSQSYYQIPSIIRKQSSHIIIKKIGTKRDRQAILRDVGNNLDKDDLEGLYDYATSGSFTNFLFIDLSAPEGQGFRKNFNQRITP